jgi:multiple sugar transport system substrate-binding protein
MFWDSSAGIPFAVRGAGDKFTVGTASVPNRENGGFLSQGTNIGMFNSGTPEQQQAAWRFLEFLMRPDNAALWAARTGYLPVRRAALKEPVLATLLEESPAYRACVDQLDRLRFEPPLSFWEQIRAELAQELEAAYRGRRSVEEALTNAEQRSQSIIRRANQRATSAP